MYDEFLVNKVGPTAVLTVIDSLVTTGKFDEAYDLTLDELKRNYDFNVPVEKKLFDDLVVLKDEIEDYLCGIFYARGSNYGDNNKDTGANVDLTIPISDYKHALSNNVNIVRGGWEFLTPDYTHILVLLDLSKYSKLFSCMDIEKSFLESKQIGDYCETKNNQGVNLYLLNALSINEVKMKYELINGFEKLLQGIQANNLKNIKIYFVLDNPVTAIDNYQFVFYFFLIHALHRAQENPDLEFNFVFNQEKFKKTFEKISLKINDFEGDRKINSTHTSKLVENLIKKALTNDSKYISQLHSLAKTIDEEFPLLILGEKGVGKTMLAQLVHNFSIRSEYRFESQNCGALLADRLEQNLFGWVKGSFTDAKKDKKGKVTLAEGGTLFLDEIDKANYGIRNALLTFIENKKYAPIGSEKEITADLKMIFGTNKDLVKLIKMGEFEADFYDRIRNKSITIPPLRDRINDVDLIVDFILKDLYEKKHQEISIEKSAREILKNYSWPGNVRELSRYLEILCYECIADGKGQITEKMILENPFENLATTESDDLENLIDLLKKFLDNWDVSNGDIQRKLIAPIIAKLFVDDSYKHWNKTKKYNEAMKIVGMDGKTFNSSTLQKCYDDYKNVRKLLGLE